MNDAKGCGKYVDGMLTEWSTLISFVSKSNITEFPFQILTLNSSNNDKTAQKTLLIAILSLNMMTWTPKWKQTSLVIVRNFYNI